ncbi:hypothetical protein QTP88_025802 [Uroleucon formosanum]
MFGTKAKMGLFSSSLPRYKKNKGVDIETKIDNDEKTILSKKDKNEKVNEKILLKRSTKIKRQREESLQSLEKQAKKMKTIPNKNFLAALIGKTVRVKIPDFDRCKIDSRTLLAVVVEIIDEEFYRLGSKAGTLNQLFTRNQFTLCEEKFISISDVPNTTTSIRQAVAQLSLSGGQVFLRSVILSRGILKSLSIKEDESLLLKSEISCDGIFSNLLSIISSLWAISL